LKTKKTAIKIIFIVSTVLLVAGLAWSDDSRFSLAPLKDGFNTFKEKLVPLKKKFNLLTENLSPDLSTFKKHFSLENRLVYQYRSLGGDSDSDIYEYWNLRGGDFFSGRLDVYFSGRLNKDIDGTTQSLLTDRFVSIEDIDDSWQDQVYQLYANWKDPQRRFRLKLGRQYVEDVGWIHMDGGFLRILEKEKINGSIFLGKPVSYYSSTSDDWTAGYTVNVSLLDGNKTRLSYVRYQDDRVSRNDDLATLDTWQRFGNQTRAHGSISFLDDEFRMAGIDVFYIAPDGSYDLYMQLNRYGDLGNQSREYDALTGILGNREKFTLFSVRSSFILKPWLTISPGLSSRIVDGSDQDNRNRGFENYDCTFNITPDDNWDTSVSINYWDVENSDHFFGLTGEVDYHKSKDWEVTVGTSYMDYEYHFDITDYSRGLSPDAYTLYSNAKIKLTDSITLKAELELEDSSLESDNALRFRTTLITRL
jgi:hypothetical protein